MIRKFSDARVTNWFAEIWGERLFSYKAHANANFPGSDALIALGAIGDLAIGVRCFRSNAIKFQKSRDIGSGRSATKESLTSALEELDRYVVVDLRRIPQITFYPLDTKRLLKLVREKRLGVSGMTPRRFDEWIAETFDVDRRTIVLPVPDPEPPPS